MMRCLVIDDDDFAREFVKTLLEKDFLCDEACNGREGVEKFGAALDSGEHYDLVILDILMPGMDGHETASTIREMEKEKGIEPGGWTNIIMITSVNSPKDAMKSFGVQSAAYLVKPVSKEKLRGVISRLGPKQGV